MQSFANLNPVLKHKETLQNLIKDSKSKAYKKNSEFLNRVSAKIFSQDHTKVVLKVGSYKVATSYKNLYDTASYQIFHILFFLALSFYICR